VDVCLAIEVGSDNFITAISWSRIRCQALLIIAGITVIKLQEEIVVKLMLDTATNEPPFQLLST